MLSLQAQHDRHGAQGKSVTGGQAATLQQTLRGVSRACPACKRSATDISTLSRHCRRKLSSMLSPQAQRNKHKAHSAQSCCRRLRRRRRKLSSMLSLPAQRNRHGTHAANCHIVTQALRRCYIIVEHHCGWQGIIHSGRQAYADLEVL